MMEDADIDWAVDVLMDGRCTTPASAAAGSNASMSMPSIFNAFVEKAVAWTNALKLGNPFDADRRSGPMANVRFARTVRDHVADAEAKGLHH